MVERAAGFPETPMSLLRREFAPLFRRFFGSWPVPYETAWELPTPYGLEMEDTESEVVVRVPVPGFEAKDLDVRVEGKLLTIHTTRKEGEEAERYWGELHETVLLPEGTDPEHVEALYRNGILEVRVPKLPEAKARRIEVTV